MTRDFRLLWRVFPGMALLFATACASASMVEVTPPETVVDPSVVSTPSGAQQLYAYAVANWPAALFGSFGSDFTGATAIMSDEAMPSAVSSNDIQQVATTNLRNDVGSFKGPWNDASTRDVLSVRRYARQAIQALLLYAPSSPPAWRARLEAAEGFGVVYLAEFMCSGYPLSMVPLNSPVILTRGFTTEEMLTQAVALFDSAIALAGDSVRFRYLAELGKGRALLDQGKFADAAAAVADVPTNFLYKFEFSHTTNVLGGSPQLWIMSDSKGTNGLVWTTDPRTAMVTAPSVASAEPMTGKYSVNASGTISPGVSNPTAPARGADGLEARLIEAEAALALNNASWLTTLNTLRSTCVGTATCAPVPGLNVAALPPLTDPGTADARLNLLMAERAMWLYMTGHRQGDLRRLAHVYRRDPTTLWPIGVYSNPGFPPLVPASAQNGVLSYGAHYVMDPSLANVGTRELDLNPLYTGCVDLNP